MKRAHHDLRVWQESIELVNDVYLLTREFPTEEQYCLTAQMRRAAISVPSNIAEGAARTTKKEFNYHLSVARGSLSEVETQLVIAERLKYSNELEMIRKRVDTIFALIGGLATSLKKKS